MVHSESEDLGEVEEEMEEDSVSSESVRYCDDSPYNSDFEEDERGKKGDRRGGNQFPCGGFPFLARQMVFLARFIISRDEYDTSRLNAFRANARESSGI